MRTHRTRIALLAATALAAAAVVTPLAFGHATLTLILPVPGTQPLANATDTWFLRVPNERYGKSTWKVVMTVPSVAQSSITLRPTPGWKTTLGLKDTGTKDGDGNPIQLIESITWQALKGNLIGPGKAFYGGFEFRFRNPATAGPVCFPVDQYYNGQTKGAPVEIVQWNGANTPCVNVV